MNKSANDIVKLLKANKDSYIDVGFGLHRVCTSDGVKLKKFTRKTMRMLRENNLLTEVKWPKFRLSDATM